MTAATSLASLTDDEQIDLLEELTDAAAEYRHVARVAEAKLDRSRRELLALRAACADLAGMTADVADVLRHELWVKYGVGLTPEQARDLSAQAVQVVAGRLDVESVQEAA